MQSSQIAWLAGIIDGEGCFSIFRRTNKSKNGNIIITPTASITITNSNLAIIEECRRILNTLGVKFTLKNPRNSKSRLLERLDIRNYISILHLIDTSLPYIIGKKEQAILMREFVDKALKRRNFSASSDRINFLDRMSKLNKFGQFIRRDYALNSSHLLKISER
ncbi:MAG: hypothetical protein UU37_C0003G0041 [Candidatus Gottesmanbacteria bacterium GW2011_GWA2_41_12]|uniref:Homing endonuclease LAGLIDADG domain-containing protein n=2 Tax=Candidatus Gottesmaniibacteriota TaxID=1752720 RepID=A0A0G0XL94_9BACT|nr:MAG: hypothetical protein UT63_C0025G0013 [Candidatus Gottesmanbacteria bacterium GW2011_GWC2_39_8]KKR88467.1 MAG: hypothetical protein UU37_C0003G0041 [Candidatus Gottesmanbacteria bacterium GW2011_GWA2_41_12]